MSMHNYAVDDYGMLVTDEVLKLIVAKVCNDYDFERDYYDLVNQLYEKGIVEYISEFTGEANEIDNNGNIRWSYGEHYDCELICYIPLKKYGTLFNAAYNSMNEIVKELRERLQEYLPDDFFYEGYIVHIVGIYKG